MQAHNVATPRLKTLLGDYANTRAIKQGLVSTAGFTLDYAQVKVPNRAFKQVVRTLDFEVAELALVTYLQARAYGKPLQLIPAVVGGGRHQHYCLVANAERAELRPEQLRGKRIGIRAFAQTTVTWVKGILSDDYGVDLDSIEWVTAEDGHLAEFADPAGCVRESSGRSAYEGLLDGSLDAAIIGTDLPNDPRLVPVIPEPHQAAAAWGKRHQLTPVNHMVVVSTVLCQERPDIVRELYRALQESKSIARENAPDSPDLTPFGVEPNRQALELLIRYAHEQRLIPQRYAVDEIFEDFNRIVL
jgi:4,5-dihydroxyphthalate decarboxylase